MAKETSIFFNATTYVSSLPDEMRYSIKSISTEVPPSRSHLKRFEKIKKDILSLPCVAIDIKTLLGILHLSDKYTFKKGGDFENVNELIKHLRKILRKYSFTEIAPPGNFIDASLDTVIRLSPSYNINNDEDIVTAKQCSGNDGLSAMLTTRIKRAVTKINNFNLCLHIFEALHIVTDNEPLTIDQNSIINSLLQNSIFPSDCKNYLLSCLSTTLDGAPLKTDLNESSAYLKPITDLELKATFLRTLAKIAAYSQKPLTFKNVSYAEELAALYKIQRQQIQVQTFNFLKEDNTNKAEESTSALRSLIYLEKLKKYKNLYKATNSEKNNFKTTLLELLKEHKFIDNSELIFIGNNQHLYIEDIPTENPNLYVCNNHRALEDNNWTFAICPSFNRQLIKKEKIRTFNEIGKHEKRNFAKSLNISNNSMIPQNVLITIGANLEYRLLVEGVLNNIDDKEKIKAQIMLSHWYKKAFYANDSTMNDLRNCLYYLGEILSINTFLDKDKSNNTHINQNFKSPYLKTFWNLLLADVILKNENKLNNTNLTTKDFDYKINDLILPIEDIIFYALILCHQNLYPNVRTVGQNSSLLYSFSYDTYKQIINQNPSFIVDILKSLSDSTEKDIYDDYFSALKCYKNFALCKLLPNKLNISEKGLAIISSIVDKIKKRQKSIHAYLNNNSTNSANEIVYRIFEYKLQQNLKQNISSDSDSDNETNNKLPLPLIAFRQDLLSKGVIAYDNAKSLFNIKINSRAECLDIMNECASVLDLTMYPNPNVEKYNTVISAYEYVTFLEDKTNIDYKNVIQIITPFRLAINAATTFSTHQYIFEQFSKFIKQEYTDIDEQNLQSIFNYCELITQIKLKKGNSCRCSNGLTEFKFTDLAKKELLILFNIVASNGDLNTNIRNITAINKKLANSPLDIFTQKNYIKTNSVFKGFSNNRVNAITSTPTELNLELIAQKNIETQQVQMILAPIFADEKANVTDNIVHESANIQEHATTSNKSSETVALTTNVNSTSNIVEDSSSNTLSQNSNETFAQLPQSCQKLLIRLLQLPNFTLEDFKKICSEVGLMHNAALEIINTWAFDNFDCTLIEEDTPMFFDKELLSECFN